MSGAFADAITDAVGSIEDVSSRIEDIFAQVGDRLGRGHAIFKELNEGLTALSRELSGSEIEAAATALQEIADQLNRLAEVLPAESALLEAIGKSAAGAASLLKPLFKHIQMITIIARSARIEAASLDGDRENFLAFTQETYDLGKEVERSIKGSARDQELLSQAIDVALGRHREFELRYRAQLLSAGSELVSAYSELRTQRERSANGAELAGTSTRSIAEAVGRLIVSLQAGDSTRQRLEHVSHALGQAAATEPGIVPDLPGVGDRARAICQLEVMQLKDAHCEFDRDIGQILHSLSAMLSDAAEVVSRGRSLYGGQDDGSVSFLDRIKQTLAHASRLIATCESAGKSVDDALTAVEEIIAKFRQAISGLGEAVVDITLIGMNAGLKAGHLGSKGNAFVVIANELKATADQVSTGASRLGPVLDDIERSANELKELRVRADPGQLARLEPAVLQALREIEAGNDRLGLLMGRLVEEGAEFQGLMNSTRELMTVLEGGIAILPAAAARLDAAAGPVRNPALDAADEAHLDELFARYTMEREREIHRDFLQRLGLTLKAVPVTGESSDVDDGVLLF
ncbi:MAG TPA: chemotaxis protein [Bradyrhizobium sp.]|nr:chemotaxis protein [Bradyrhizobium sp.]